MYKRQKTIIRKVTDIPWRGGKESYPHYRDMALVKIENGQGRFVDAINRFDLPDGKKGLYRSVSLDGRKLVQIRDAENPAYYGYGEIAPGEGLENFECQEMHWVDEAFHHLKPYAGFEDSLELLKPLLSLLNSGYYMVVDTYLCPTDGGERVFWDIDDNPRVMPSFQSRWDYGRSETTGAHPQYLYPAKWPSAFSENILDDFELLKTLGEDRQPRAIAYAISGNTALLLDGHYKAIYHQENYELVPCLVIIPHQKKEGWNPERQKSFFADISFWHEDLNSSPTFVDTSEADFAYYPAMRNPYWADKETDNIVCFPRADVYSGDIKRFLTVNMARLLRYDLNLEDAVYGNAAWFPMGTTGISDTDLFAAVARVAEDCPAEPYREEGEPPWFKNGKSDGLEFRKYALLFGRIADILLCIHEGYTLEDYERISGEEVFHIIREAKEKEGWDVLGQAEAIMERFRKEGFFIRSDEDESKNLAETHR